MRAPVLIRHCNRNVTSDVFNYISRVTGLRSSFELQIANFVASNAGARWWPNAKNVVNFSSDCCTAFHWIGKKRRDPCAVENGEADITHDQHGDVQTSKTCSRVSHEQTERASRVNINETILMKQNTGYDIGLGSNYCETKSRICK